MAVNQANLWGRVTRLIARFWSIGVALLSIVVAVAWMALQLSLPADGYSSSFGKLAPPGAVVDADLVTNRPMAPTASEESIAQGDIITAAGGHTIEEWLRASLPGRNLSNREWQVGATIPYTILRAGQEQTVTVRLIRLPLADIVQAGLITYSLVLFILALTIFMVIRKPDEPATHILLVCASATTVLQTHEVIDLQVSLIVHPALFWGAVLLENLAIWFCYAPLAHAFLIFPEKKGVIQRHSVIIWLVYLIYPVFVLGGALLNGPAVASHLAGAGRCSTFAMILLFVILGIGIGHSFFTARTLKARSQIRWIAWGFAAGMMPLLFLHLLPRDLFGQAILPAEIALIPIFLAPLALTVAVVRHNLFDIELIINRSLVYGTLTVLLTSLYLLLVRLLTLMAQAITPAGNETLVVFVATLIIALAFAPLRQRVQGMIDRAFYRTKLDYQRMLSEMSAQLATNIFLERLVPLLMEELPRRLQIARASLLVLDPEGQTLISFDDENGTGLPVDHSLAENLRRSGQPLLRSYAERHLPDEASAFLQGLLAGGVELSIPLIVGQRLVGVYNLGAKLSGISYTRDEVQLLTVLGQQAAVSVENARLYQEIEGYSRILEQKVEQRAAELTTANEQLKQEITERKRAEEALRRRNRELVLLNRVGQELTATLDLQQVIVQLLRAATEIIGAEGASVWLWDEKDEEQQGWLICRTVFHQGQGRSPVNLRLRSGQGVAGWVAQNGESVVVASTSDDPRFSPTVDEQTGFRTTSLLAVPLRIRDAVVGVLEVVNKQSGDFDVDDRALVETLAASAAIAMDNAGLVEALRQRTAELETRNEELDAFAHTVAHDLKSPLGQIVGYAGVLQEDYATLSDKDLHRCLYTIARNGRKMSNIVNELLLLAVVRRLEEVEMGPLDMASIVTEAQQRLALTIEEHQAEIILPEAWPVALGYSPWVEEVWTNYLSNAIKYGGRPPLVELGASPPSVPFDKLRAGSPACRGEVRGGMVCFWVRDNGPGISPEAQGRLFTPFTRLDQVSAKGHGLGLSIVRRIVEKLGGQVGVESQVGQGSVFTFTLPGVQTESRAASSREGQGDQSTLAM